MQSSEVLKMSTRDTNDAHGNEQEIFVQDDSFDAEISLLESTLTECQGDDESLSCKKNCSENSKVSFTNKSSPNHVGNITNSANRPTYFSNLYIEKASQIYSDGTSKTSEHCNKIKDSSMNFDPKCNSNDKFSILEDKECIPSSNVYNEELPSISSHKVVVDKDLHAHSSHSPEIGSNSDSTVSSLPSINMPTVSHSNASSTGFEFSSPNRPDLEVKNEFPFNQEVSLAQKPESSTIQSETYVDNHLNDRLATDILRPKVTVQPKTSSYFSADNNMQLLEAGIEAEQLNTDIHDAVDLLNKVEQEKTVSECNESIQIKSTSETATQEAKTIVSQVSLDEKHHIDEIKPSSEVAYCSTPNAFRSGRVDFKSEELDLDNDFGRISPLGLNRKTLNERKKPNLKRKPQELECIEEADENSSDSLSGKKFKRDGSPEKSNLERSLSQGCPPEVETSSSIHCFEAPAKSILKKWQSSGLARGSASTSSYLIVDECGESDVEDTANSQQVSEGEGPTDDFDTACKILDDLMKSSSNNEALEKYQSQVMLESQINNDKFDELIQELSQNYDLDDKTSLTFKTMSESCLTETQVSDLDQTITEEVNNKLPNQTVKHANDEINNLVISIKTDENKSSVRKIIEQNQSVIENRKEIKSEAADEQIYSSTSSSGSQPIDDNQNGNPMPIDEEDFLLNEDNITNKKPYVFFEFVSENPQENEDNYNPEWQKLGRLTSDEERYKAVRERWRSLIPPDPNRNLTCRQWRKKNNKPPLKITSLNNNHPMASDGEKTQLCTAMYQQKIRKLLHELGERSREIKKQMNKDFDQLGIEQDAEQQTLMQRGGTGFDLARLHHRHIEECRSLKSYHEKELKEIKNKTDIKVQTLKDASKEVLLFQKFYRGVGAVDDTVCMYSDVEVQELMETEDMLEQYTRYYQ